MELSLVSKAKTALQNAAAKAERVLIEIKADIKADFGRPPTPECNTRLNGKYNYNAERKIEFPWSAKNDSEKRHEAEFKRRILEFSKKPEDFLDKVYDENESVDMRTAMLSVGSVLEVDEVLRDLWFQYVPKKMKEHEFWRRYFIAVKRVRQEVMDSDAENAVSRSWSSIERRLTFGGIGNESLRKDPSEEEAYKEAFSVITVPPSMIVRRLAAVIEVGRAVKSMQELATQGGRLSERDGLSNSGDWSGIVSSFAAMKRLSGGRDKDNKLRFSKTHSLGDYQTLLWSLFDADTQHEDREDKRLSFCGGPKLPEEVHGAPPESFVAQLAEIMAGIKTEQGMAEFWMEVIKEAQETGRRSSISGSFEFISNSGRLFSTMSSSSIWNSGGCSPNSACTAPLETPPVLLYAKTKGGEKVLRVGADRPAADLLMLETGEPVYSPITQENPVMTEDAIRETEELILRTRSVGAGCSQLLSDMQAFKAANPGCILEDFVRWYSPLDWREEPGSGLMFQGSAENIGDDAAIRGYLSVRMQCQGNLWQELWASSRPVPALKQAPLFDEELAGESTLDALEKMAPSDLFEQLFIAAVSAGFAIAESAPAVKTEALAKCLRECTEYAVATCGRGMSTSKLEYLCKVYELMESAIHSPPCDETVEAGAVITGPTCTTDVSDEFNYDLPEPIPLLDSEKITLRKSADQQSPQFVKAENLGNLISRIFEVKTSLFEKKHLRPFSAEERRSATTVSGEWTFV